jgi:WD40-like Beta Propeller Repeat
MNGNGFARVVVRLFIIIAISRCVFAEDTAVTPAAEPATQSPMRPILHFKASGETAFLAAVYADGSEVKMDTAGLSAAWAPGGDRFAYVSPAGELRIGTLQGDTKTILPPRVSWPTWSPDGQRIAVISERSIVVVDAKTKKVVLRHKLKDTIGFPYPSHPIYRFGWSPDGSKLLLAFENTIVLDVKKNKVQVIASKPAPAEWAPSSNAVYCADFQEGGPDVGDLRSIALRKLDASEGQVLMSREAMAASRLVSQDLIPVLLRLSPDGARLAIVLSSGGEGLEAARDRFMKARDAALEETRRYVQGLSARDADQDQAARKQLDAAQAAADESYGEIAKLLTTILRIYDVGGDHPRVQEPSSEFRTSRIIAALDWAPDGKALAATTIPNRATPEGNQGNSITLEVLSLADGSWRTLASSIISVEQTEALGWFRAMSWGQ